MGGLIAQRRGANQSRWPEDQQRFRTRGSVGLRGFLLRREPWSVTKKTLLVLSDGRAWIWAICNAGYIWWFPEAVKGSLLSLSIGVQFRQPSVPLRPGAFAKPASSQRSLGPVRRAWRNARTDGHSGAHWAPLPCGTGRSGCCTARIVHPEVLCRSGWPMDHDQRYGGAP